MKHSTVLTEQQPLRFLGKRICRHPNGDITVSVERSYYYSMLKHMGLDDNINPTSTPSLRRPPVPQNTSLDPDRHHIYRKVVGMLIWASLVRPDLQFTAKDHTRHLASPTEWDWSHLKHTLRYIKGTLHYKYLISPRLPQGHSVPLRQLIPLHYPRSSKNGLSEQKNVRATKIFPFCGFRGHNFNLIQSDRAG